MEVQVSRLVAAIPERVMAALTDPAQLTRWGCAQAEVTADRFRLQGEGVPTGAMGGRLLERDADRLLFEWPLGEDVSTVSVALKAVPQAGHPPADFTRVTVHHRAIPDGALPARWPEESWECAWALWLRHLQGWVERAEVPAAFSFAGPFGTAVERSLEVDAPPGRVWAALTDPAIRRRWLTVPLGRELRREEGRLLVCTFELEQPATTLTWLLEPLPGGRTRVTVREEGLTWEGIDNYLGWHEYLVALKQETAPPLIRQTVWIGAPPARVWARVGSQEGLRRWFSSNIRFEPQVGAPVALEAHGGRLRGRVTAVEPERRLSFSWTEDGAGWPEPEPLLLTLALVPEGEGTRVYLTHSGFENLPEVNRAKAFDSYRRGWASGSSLGSLRRAVESEERCGV